LQAHISLTTQSGNFWIHPRTYHSEQFVPCGDYNGQITAEIFSQLIPFRLSSMLIFPKTFDLENCC